MSTPVAHNISFPLPDWYILCLRNYNALFQLTWCLHCLIYITGTRRWDAVQSQDKRFWPLISFRYRFMAMDRLGSDLQKVCEHSGGRMKKATVLQLGQGLVRSLFFINVHRLLFEDRTESKSHFDSQWFPLRWRAHTSDILHNSWCLWPAPGECTGVHPWERVCPCWH